eukprot:CAMPEP_0119479316 /NCGR_PEP_ID=MMETSP1344-20130328/8642_1 /TAXON_ID=236787 /ORGANISM="Florenciella parvula, Strain CCMP2471" /LENGTH=136 /DNA_ID=CAMNT_0007513541 /DNA_START=421 /DNA_END=831 /DNA_ORIENTATION=+
MHRPLRTQVPPAPGGLERQGASTNKNLLSSIPDHQNLAVVCRVERARDVHGAARQRRRHRYQYAPFALVRLAPMPPPGVVEDHHIASVKLNGLRMGMDQLADCVDLVVAELFAVPPAAVEGLIAVGQAGVIAVDIR